MALWGKSMPRSFSTACLAAGGEARLENHRGRAGGGGPGRADPRAGCAWADRRPVRAERLRGAGAARYVSPDVARRVLARLDREVRGRLQVVATGGDQPAEAAPEEEYAPTVDGRAEAEAPRSLAAKLAGARGHAPTGLVTAMPRSCLTPRTSSKACGIAVGARESAPTGCAADDPAVPGSARGWLRDLSGDGAALLRAAGRRGDHRSGRRSAGRLGGPARRNRGRCGGSGDSRSETGGGRPAATAAAASRRLRGRRSRRTRR